MGSGVHGLSEATDKNLMHHLKMKGVLGVKFLNGFNKPFFYRWKKTCLDVISDDEDSDCKFCGCRIFARKEEVYTKLTSTKLQSPSLSSMHLSHPGRYSSTSVTKRNY